MQVTLGGWKPRNNVIIKKLSLEKGEQARVAFIDPSPQLVYVHTFNKLVTGPDGRPIVIKDTWPDGSPRESYKQEYAGKFLCLGDEKVLEASEADPDNCPACKGALDHPNAIKKAQPRILAQVIKYSTKPGGWNLTNPFSAQLIVWDLTQKRWEQLNDIYEEHGDLSQIDLLLGPCEDKNYQKFAIAVGRDEAKYLSSKENIEYVNTLQKEERLKDVSTVAAKKPLEYELTQKVNEVVRAYNHAMGVQENSAYDSLLDSDNTDNDTEDDDERETAGLNRRTVVADVEDDESPFAADDDDDDTEEDEDGDETPSLEDLLKNFG